MPALSLHRIFRTNYFPCRDSLQSAGASERYLMLGWQRPGALLSVAIHTLPAAAPGSAAAVPGGAAFPAAPPGGGKGSGGAGPGRGQVGACLPRWAGMGPSGAAAAPWGAGGCRGSGRRRRAARGRVPGLSARRGVSLPANGAGGAAGPAVCPASARRPRGLLGERLPPPSALRGAETGCWS